VRRPVLIAVVFLLALAGASIVQADGSPDTTRDILVTFDNTGARQSNGGLSAPYRHRKRYSIARSVRRHAAAIAAEHTLVEIEHWPIRALSVYCFVFRIADGADRGRIIARLNADDRVESAQLLQRFETGLSYVEKYDDTYAKLQYGLELLDIAAAHEASTGAGVSIAIIDSLADKNHEDLRGRISRIRHFSGNAVAADKNHGTAVVSVIGANSNNAIGIVGVAPDASLDLYVSCWSGGAGKPAICDSFSLLRALDTVLEDRPAVLNLSLTGPHDALLERMLEKVLQAGVVVVAAGATAEGLDNPFPSSMNGVISVVSSSSATSMNTPAKNSLYAPGDRILVAVPINQYDFRSGSSLATAHVSGVVALLLAVAPQQSSSSIREILERSQLDDHDSPVSINACTALKLLDSAHRCGG
jgi:subtilisin family serine protease